MSIAHTIPASMTTVPVASSARISGAGSSSSVPVTPIAPATLELSWEVGSGALVRGAPGVLNGHAATLRSARLCVEVPVASGPRFARASLVVECASGVDRIDLGEVGPMSITLDGERGLLHADHERLSLTVSLAGTTPTLLYARCSLVGELGLSGGTYDAPVLASRPASVGRVA